MNLKKKYSIQKSKHPEGNKTHIVFVESYSEHGCNMGRVFKGTLEECKEELARRRANYEKKVTRRENNTRK